MYYRPLVYLLIWDGKVRSVAPKASLLNFSGIPVRQTFHVAVGECNPLRKVIGTVAVCIWDDPDARVAYVTSPQDGVNRMIRMSKDPRALVRERLRTMQNMGELSNPDSLSKFTYIESRS